MNLYAFLDERLFEVGREALSTFFLKAGVMGHHHNIEGFPSGNLKNLSGSKSGC